MNSLNERTRNKLYTATEEVFCLMDKYSERLQNYFIEFIYEELFSLTKRDIQEFMDIRVTHIHPYLMRYII